MRAIATWLPAFTTAATFAIVGPNVGCQSDAGATKTEAASGALAPGDAAGIDVSDIDVETLAQWERERAQPQKIAAGLGADADEAVRVRAALALARLQHQQAVDGLIRALRDPSPKVRSQAAFGLGQLDEALVDHRATHNAARDRIQTQLIGTLNQESDPAVRSALIAALGRVGRTPALRTLTALAAAGSHRAEALRAIGVNATRDQPLAPAPAPLVAAVDAGLKDAAPDVQTAAAYAAFRQGLSVAALVPTASSASSPQARIYALRALEKAPESIRQADLEAWFRDLDWRVRLRALDVGVAAARASIDLEAEVFEAPLNVAIDNLARGLKGGEAHVVAHACHTLAKTHPADGRHIIERALKKMEPLLPKHASTRCACAVARDAIEGEVAAVTRCHGGSFDAAAARRLEVAVVRHAGIPSVVRAKSLDVALNDKDRLVRLDAAEAAAEDDAPAMARMARMALLDETDPGVIAAHLAGFLGKRREEILNQLDLSHVVRTLLALDHKDTLEPLLLAAQIAAERGFTSTTALLIEAEDTRVVDAAREVALYDRPLGPRATVPKAPDVERLPTRVSIATDRGTFVIELFRDVAPVTVATFSALAKQGVTVGTLFHRVVPDFVAQGGDPRGDGYGGPGFTIPCERSAEEYTTGTVGMALAGLDTGGSQFFIVHSGQPHLTGRYSVFGRVISGQDIVDALVAGDRIIRFAFEGASE